jgi:uncharacterized protein YcaQ
VDVHGWTNERNVERMLTFLWVQGTVLVAGRSGGSRVGPGERVLPDWTPAAAGAGQASPGHRAEPEGPGWRPCHIKSHFVPGATTVPAALDALERDGRVKRLAVADDGVARGPWFVHADDLVLLDRIEAGEWEPRRTLLSPFDNVIHNRDRTLELFDFHYRIQIYVPAAKRPYGYYVMPVLDGERIVGRIDPAFDRKGNRLLVKSVHSEAGVSARAVERALKPSLNDLAAFLGAEDVVMTPAPD